MSKIKKYLNVAKEVSKFSKDENTKVGAILVDPDDGAIVAVGYNGFVRGSPDYLIPKTRPEKYKYTIHAELNLLLNCARHGISVKNKIVYCTHSPCNNCARHLKNAGINKIIFKNLYANEILQEDLDLKFSLKKEKNYFILNFNNE